MEDKSDSMTWITLTLKPCRAARTIRCMGLVDVRFVGGFYDDSGVIPIDPGADGLPPTELKGGRDAYRRSHDDDGIWVYRLKNQAF
jgi:hypothetical protein